MPRVEPTEADLATAMRYFVLARSLMTCLEGVEPIEQVGALITAATMVIETRFAPEDRLGVLNSMLAETIRGWAPAPMEARII